MAPDLVYGALCGFVAGLAAMLTARVWWPEMFDHPTATRILGALSAGVGAAASIVR